MKGVDASKGGAIERAGVMHETDAVIVFRHYRPLVIVASVRPR